MSVSKAQWKDQAIAGTAVPLFKFLVKTSDGTVDVAGAGALAYGVSCSYEKDGAIGDLITMDMDGIVKVTAGATVATGAIVASDANGDAIAAATGAYPLGVARKGGADGDIIEVVFSPTAVVVPA